jgi:hypothetical protein
MQRKLLRPLAAVAFLAVAAGAAHARDNVFWSVGIDAAPGVSVGVSNARPVYVAPAPVVVAPQPVYVTRPVVVSRPVVLVEEPVYYSGRHGHKHKHKHHRHHRHDD